MDIGMQVGGTGKSSRPLRAAFGVSLAIHVAIFLIVGGGRHDLAPESMLVVTLPLESSQAIAIGTPLTPMPTPSPATVDPPRLVHEAPQHDDRREESARSQRDDPDPHQRAAKRAGIAPELARELANQRLRVLLRIAPDGTVLKVDAGGNELSPWAESQVAKVLAPLRFAPPQNDEESSVRGRLCFDDQGEIADSDPECSALAAKLR